MVEPRSVFLPCCVLQDEKSAVFTVVTELEHAFAYIESYKGVLLVEFTPANLHESSWWQLLGMQQVPGNVRIESYEAATGGSTMRMSTAPRPVPNTKHGAGGFNVGVLRSTLAQAANPKKCTFKTVCIDKDTTDAVLLDIMRAFAHPPDYCRRGSAFLNPESTFNCVTWLEKILKTRGIELDNSRAANLVDFFVAVPSLHMRDQNGTIAIYGEHAPMVDVVRALKADPHCIVVQQRVQRVFALNRRYPRGLDVGSVQEFEENPTWNTEVQVPWHPNFAGTCSGAAYRLIAMKYEAALLQAAPPSFFELASDTFWKLVF